MPVVDVAMLSSSPNILSVKLLMISSMISNLWESGDGDIFIPLNQIVNSKTVSSFFQVMGSFSSSFHCEHECNSGIVRLRESSSKVHTSRVLRKFSPSKQTCLWIIKDPSLLQKHNMVSSYTREHPPLTMNKKIDDMGCQSDDGISNVPKTVLVGISHELHPDNDGSIMTMEDVLNARGVSTDIEDDKQTVVY